MTAQEILEGITRHRADPLDARFDGGFGVQRKMQEIEWALQALAEKLVEFEERGKPPPNPPHPGNYASVVVPR